MPPECMRYSSPHLPVTPAQLMRPSWYWPKHILCSEWLCITSSPIFGGGDVVHWLFTLNIMRWTFFLKKLDTVIPFLNYKSSEIWLGGESCEIWPIKCVNRLNLVFACRHCRAWVTKSTSSSPPTPTLSWLVVFLSPRLKQPVPLLSVYCCLTQMEELNTEMGNVAGCYCHTINFPHSIKIWLLSNIQQVLYVIYFLLCLFSKKAT